MTVFCHSYWNRLHIKSTGYEFFNLVQRQEIKGDPRSSIALPSPPVAMRNSRGSSEISDIVVSAQRHRRDDCPIDGDVEGGLTFL